MTSDRNKGLPGPLPVNLKGGAGRSLATQGKTMLAWWNEECACV
jgi:hypothetical protein